jgi:hypothetical protein
VNRRHSIYRGTLFATLMLTSAVHADCAFYDLPCAARQAGRDAALEVAKGMDVATLNARELTNQFGALVSDLYGPDPARAARARSIFEGVLGRNLAAGEAPRLQLSVILVGGPRRPLMSTLMYSLASTTAQ